MINGAVVVLYNPKQSTIDFINDLASQFDFVVVANNGDELGILSEIKQENIVIIDMHGNMGIATALNSAIQILLVNSIKYISIFDQDSKLPKDYVDDMIKIFENIRMMDADIRQLAPNYKDVNSDELIRQLILGKMLFRKVVPQNNVQISAPIASGSMYDSRVFQEVGFFEDDYFIDYVDNEHSLRIASMGFKVYAAASVVMLHALGERRIKKIGNLKFIPTNHSKDRKYYMTRNRILTLKKFALFYPSFLIFEILAFFNDLIRVMLFEEDRIRKMKLICKGIKDGILGNKGKL